MINNKIDLKRFCSTDLSRINLAEPFSKGQYSYATNGHTAIRVPRRDDIPENPQASDCERLFVEADRHDPYEWVNVPEMIKISRSECNCCDDCVAVIEKCESVQLRTSSGQIMAWGLSNLYLRDILEELPNPKIGISGKHLVASNNVPPVKIRFDGGDGLLMPRRV